MAVIFLLGNSGPIFADASIHLSDLKIRGAGRVDVTYSDDGLKKSADYTPESYIKTRVPILMLDLEGRAGAASILHLAADVTRKEPLEVYRVSYQANSWFTLSAGRSRVRVAGYDLQNWDYTTLLLSPYTKAFLPFLKLNKEDKEPRALAAPNAELAFQSERLGTLTLQVLDDVVKDEYPSANYSNTKRQPAVVMQWDGSFSEHLSGLAQGGLYDLNHSGFAVVGVHWKTPSFSLYSDYVIDWRSNPTPAGEDRRTIFRSFDLDIKGSVQNFEPFIKIVALDVVQPSPDRKGNSPGVVFDDNMIGVSLGSYWRLDGDAFKPYFAMTQSYGKFLVATAQAGGDTETNKLTEISFGLCSAF